LIAKRVSGTTLVESSLRRRDPRRRDLGRGGAAPLGKHGREHHDRVDRADPAGEPLRFRPRNAGPGCRTADLLGGPEVRVLVRAPSDLRRKRLCALSAQRRGRGGPGGGYLTVATYHFPDAYQALQNVKDGTHLSIAGDGDVQVEVYDPSAAVALSVARSGRVRPAR
jgi:hypothetical protein